MPRPRDAPNPHGKVLPESRLTHACLLLRTAFVATLLPPGLVHMVPDCQQAQRRLWPDEGGGGIPTLYLMLIALGYLLVFFVVSAARWYKTGT